MRLLQCLVVTQQDTNASSRLASGRILHHGERDKLATELSWQRFPSKLESRQFSATTPVFNLPHLHLAPTLGVTLFEFCLNFRQQKTRVPGYRVALFAWLAVWVEHRLKTDGQTDKQTNTRRQLISALASVARVKMTEQALTSSWTSICDAEIRSWRISSVLLVPSRNNLLSTCESKNRPKTTS